MKKLGASLLAFFCLAPGPLPAEPGVDCGSWVTVTCFYACSAGAWSLVTTSQAACSASPNPAQAGTTCPVGAGMFETPSTWVSKACPPGGGTTTTGGGSTGTAGTDPGSDPSSECEATTVLPARAATDNGKSPIIYGNEDRPGAIIFQTLGSPEGYVPSGTTLERDIKDSADLLARCEKYAPKFGPPRSFSMVTIGGHGSYPLGSSSLSCSYPKGETDLSTLKETIQPWPDGALGSDIRQCLRRLLLPKAYLRFASCQGGSPQQLECMRKYANELGAPVLAPNGFCTADAAAQGYATSKSDWLVSYPDDACIYKSEPRDCTKVQWCEFYRSKSACKTDAGFEDKNCCFSFDDHRAHPWYKLKWTSDSCAAPSCDKLLVKNAQSPRELRVWTRSGVDSVECQESNGSSRPAHMAYDDGHFYFTREIPPAPARETAGATRGATSGGISAGIFGTPP